MNFVHIYITCLVQVNFSNLFPDTVSPHCTRMGGVNLYCFCPGRSESVNIYIFINITLLSDQNFLIQIQ